MSQDSQYIKALGKTIQSFLAPIKDVPFGVAIKVLSGHKILAFQKNDNANRKLLSLLAKAATQAGKNAHKDGIVSSRANEVGNKIEPYVKKALNSLRIAADTPLAKSGKRKATGYPDIEISYDNGKTAYLECKTYNIKNIETTQRSFYFSPAKDFKITKDALHLLLGYQVERVRRGSKQVFVPTHWRLYTLKNLTVDVKHEFNQNNKNLYDSKFLLVEGGI